MAALSGVFSNTVRGALAIAEAELACKGVEMEKIKDALEDMRSLLEPISIRHFNTRFGFKHIVGNLFPMLQRCATLADCRLADLQTCRLADLQTCRPADL